MIMRLYLEAIFYLNGPQQLTFLKNNELYKQYGKRLLSSSAVQAAQLSGHWEKTLALFVSWLVESFVPSFTSTYRATGGTLLPEFSLCSSCSFLLPFLFFLTASLQLGSLLASPKSKPHSTLGTQLKSHIYHKILCKNLESTGSGSKSWLDYILVLATHITCLNLNAMK